MKIPENLKYTKDHEWVVLNGDIATIGITDFAQGELGDIVFVEIETVGEKLSKEEIEGRIKDYVRSMNLNSGDGYFFIDTLNGYVLLRPMTPEIEGKSIMDIRNGEGRKIGLEMMEAMKKHNSSFLEYNWKRDKDSFEESPKITYIKKVEELGWYVGFGEYVESHEDDVKNKIINKIKNISRNENDYVFVADWNGNILAGPGEGKNLLNVRLKSWDGMLGLENM